jgi:SAM-dependent methyltransferase
MDPRTYDQWYATPRGRWIGDSESKLVQKALQARPGESLLDVGCGTGYFTRRFASSLDGPVHGVDITSDWIKYAKDHSDARIVYHVADACELPFQDGSFDLVTSIAALCFIPDERAAIREMLRVCRRRFAIGVLNRHSLLWRKQGRSGGTGAYVGARWHEPSQLLDLFRVAPVANLKLHSAVHIPSGGPVARTAEPILQRLFLSGALLVVSGEALGGNSPMP